MTYALIAGGTVYDPAHGVDGEVRDLWIADGKIVAPPDDPAVRPSRTIDAAGLAVMPGGIDMHCHIVGPAVNAARLMSPEARRPPHVEPRRPGLRSGTRGLVPSAQATGYLYAGLGYTTAFDAAIAPLAARHAHCEFADVPCLDKGLYVLAGNNRYALECIERGERERLRHFLAWLINRAGAYAPKLVNPGGVEAWKRSPDAAKTGLDDPAPGFSLTPRDVIREIVAAANDLNLPHPAHIHCNQLGMPGNWTTTLETMRALEGRRAHLTHIQFHSYGGGDEEAMSSRVAELAAHVNSHSELTVDVGQVLFGDAMALTADGGAGYFLHRLYGDRWTNVDVECEAGCGVTPIKYRRKSVVHALQWAIGLEWYLLVDDPWQVMMSTDHPNGGSFLAYPQIVALLMDRQLRRDALASLPPAVRNRSTLADLDREYTLGEIATITRAAPARALGLAQKGHLGVGADADVTIYTPGADRQAMFELPRLVIKAGEIVVEQGEVRSAPTGDALLIRPPYDEAVEPAIAKWFEKNYSLQVQNYGVGNLLDSPQ